jgi:hypothetical protein
MVLSVVLPLTAASDYEYQTSDDGRNITLSSEDYSLITGGGCSSNHCRTIVYLEYYRIPENYIRTGNVYLEAYYGMLVTPQNLSLNYSNRYNDTHFSVGVIGEYDPNPSTTDWMRSRAVFYNGTLNVLGELRSENKEFSSPESSEEGYLYDGNTATGVFYNNNNPTTYVTAHINDEEDNEAQIREVNLYWYRGGDDLDVTFTIKNGLGVFIDGAEVTVTRYLDNVSQGIKTSDVAGQVEYDLTEGIQYIINVTASGYDNYSGVITAIDSSYNIVLSNAASVPFHSIYKYLTVFTSPAYNPINATITNFTIQLNSTNNTLTYWGLNSSFNGTNYLFNDTTAAGGIGNLTINLTGQENKTIHITYFMLLEGEGFFSYTEDYLIYEVSPSSTSLIIIMQDVKEEIGDLWATIFGVFGLVLIIIFLSVAGVPAEWGAPIIIIPGIIFLITMSWVNVIIGSLVVMVTIGALILRNWRN